MTRVGGGGVGAGPGWDLGGWGGGEGMQLDPASPSAAETAALTPEAAGPANTRNTARSYGVLAKDWLVAMLCAAAVASAWRGGWLVLDAWLWPRDPGASAALGLAIGAALLAALLLVHGPLIRCTSPCWGRAQPTCRCYHMPPLTHTPMLQAAVQQEMVEGASTMAGSVTAGEGGCGEREERAKRDGEREKR